MRADVIETLHRFGGIATRSQIVGSGVTPTDLSSAMRAGAISRVRRGHYRAPVADRDAVSAVAIGGRLSCISAARSYGLWAGRDDRLHVRLPSNAARLRQPIPLDAVRLHWDDGELTEFCWRDSVADCLRSTVACCDPETAVAVIDSALGSGLTTVPGVRRIFQHESRRHRRVAAAAKPGSESGIESIARQRLERAGFDVEQQVHIAEVGRVDFRLNEKLLMEVDGFEFHSSRKSFIQDRRRDVMSRWAGWLSVRFAAAQVLDEWDFVEAAVKHVLYSGDPAETVPPAPVFRKNLPFRGENS
jgi:very-short-patch-repair endonuclease